MTVFPELFHKYDHEFPSQFLEDFLEYLNLDEENFFSTIDKFRNPNLWHKEKDSWVLKAQVN